MTHINEILEKINTLEGELTRELEKRHDDLRDVIKEKKQWFSEEVERHHRELATKISDYVYDSGILKILTIPIIWGALVPAIFLDAVVCLYQIICFPIYGIPRVKRSQYVVIDRHALGYLNWLEKMNCIYCGYFNGVMGFVREVAARTEQYWCPVRHAKPVAAHSRYKYFFEFGDGDAYHERLAEVRNQFDDVREKPRRQ
jgi:hypothetical protein